MLLLDVIACVTNNAKAFIVHQYQRLKGSFCCSVFCVCLKVNYQLLKAFSVQVKLTITVTVRSCTFSMDDNRSMRTQSKLY